VEVVIVPSAAEVGELGADIVAGLAGAAPNAVVGLATGSTPMPVYQALARRVADGLDLSRLRGFALDEYVGLPPSHPASYHHVITEEVVRPLGLEPGNVRVPDGTAADLEAACADYERAIIAAGGVDIQLLGIGTDGHLGFNEPSSSLASRTRIKTLTDQTRHDNGRFFAHDEEVPRHCLTQGIGTILGARHLLLLATGTVKAAAVAAAVEGPVSARVPASAVQLHPHVTVLVDEAAAGGLALAEYYRETFRHKPAWQGL
jgi:glucosamine-6-phosphate deaminase